MQFLISTGFYGKRHMHLHEVIAGLSAPPAETIIFAERIEGQFRPESAAVALELSETDLCRPVHDVAAERVPGMAYFLEASIAFDMLAEWRANPPDHLPDLDALVERIIDYAENDA